MKSDQERVNKLLTDTVTLLCKNGLVYHQEIKVQGLLGITLDENEVFLAHINELIPGNVAVPTSERSTTTASSELSPMRKNTVAGSSKVVDLTPVSDDPHPVPQSFFNRHLLVQLQPDGNIDHQYMWQWWYHSSKVHPDCSMACARGWVPARWKVLMCR